MLNGTKTGVRSLLRQLAHIPGIDDAYNLGNGWAMIKYAQGKAKDWDYGDRIGASGSGL
jgi:hypothetical protein